MKVRSLLASFMLMAAAGVIYAELPSASAPILSSKPVVNNPFKQKTAAKTSSTEVKQMPYSGLFTTEAMFNEFTVINANGDYKSNGVECTWFYNEDLQTARYSYSGENNADDWLISPMIYLEAGMKYNFTINCKNYKSQYYGDYEEKFEVFLGTDDTAASMTQRVMNAKTVRGGEFKDFSAKDITVETTGNYRIGIHCVSDAYRGELDVKSIKFDVIPLDDAPSAATNFTVTPAANGDAEAVISFTAPTTTYSGSTLAGNLTAIKIRRNGEEITSFENVTPGQTITYTDNASIPNGKNSYQILPYNAVGIGALVEQTAYVGVDIPQALTNVVITDPTVDTMTISWDEVSTVGANGYVVNPAKTGYAVYSTIKDGYTLSIDEEVGIVINQTSLSFVNNNDDGTQKLRYWVVVPFNLAGTGTVSTVSYYTGKSHELPFTEHLTATGFENSTWTYSVRSPKFTILDISDDSSDNDGHALTLYTESGDGEWGALTAGKISLAGSVNPAFSFDAKSRSTDNHIYVYIITPDGNRTLVSDFAPTTEYETYRVSLKDFLDYRYVRFEVRAEFNTAFPFFFDNFKVAEVQQKDLSVSLKLPSSANAGVCDSKAKVIVKNEGEQAVSNFTIKLSGKGTTFANETIYESIPSMGKYTADYTFPLSVIEKEGSATIKCEIIYDDDQDNSNNSTSAKLKVVASKLPTPLNLAIADESAAGTTITWEQPDLHDTDVIEDFEDTDTFAPFSVGELDEDGFGAFGEWGLYDGDKSTTYSFQNYTFENNGDNSAWQVFNPSQVPGTFLDDYDEYQPFSGNQYLSAWCPNDGSAADNWIISPKLNGNAQTISFYATEVTEDYGVETLEVLISKKMQDPSTFTKVADINVDRLGWQKYTADLPEGTKYFAIRHTSKDIFGVFIDDLSYTLGANVLVGYNFYLDGVKFATVKDANALQYVFSNVLSTSTDFHKFGVSALYEDDQESTPIYISNSDSVDSISFDELKEYPAYNIFGQRVSPDTKGIVIINGKKILNK
jgi:hypothetical protein